MAVQTKGRRVAISHKAPPSVSSLGGWLVGVVSLYESGRGAELTFHLHMTPRLRMCGSVALFQSYAFMTCTERTLSFFFFCVEYITH